jgi:DNA-binding GntR family transcriptional regulator
MKSLPARDNIRQQLSQDVATYVRELIISGAIRKNEFIRIETVAKAMSISNTPVREGLLLLQNENFVRLMPKGVW